MNEILILEAILKQNITAFEDMEVHYGFKCIDSHASKYGWSYVILQSAETTKLYKFYINYDYSMRQPYLSDDNDIREVERKEHKEVVVYYEEVIR